MKLNFRDLKQQKFTIDAEASDTILQVKEKIAAEKGWEASTQKLIYSGKILADANTVESYKIEEKGFIVCMVSKPKAAPAPKAAPVPATPQPAAASTPAVPAAPQQPSTSASTAAANPPATPSPAQPAAGGSSGFGDHSAMMIGGRSESAIREMEAMGFARGDAEAALRAAYYNPDRAIDYLLNGIPESVQAEQAAQAAQRQQQQQQQQQQAAGAQAGQQATTPAPAAGAGTTTAPAADTQAEEVDLFAQAAQQAQGGGNRGAGARGAAAGTDPLAALTGAGAGAAAGAGAGSQANVSMDFLRNSEHFQHLRRLVQQQPAMLEPILQQVAEGNPQLAQIISQNSEAFLQLLSEDINLGEGGDQPAGHIQVTQEEHDAIERLCGLGFDRNRVIQAYFACDKNEELAANFLFNETDDDFQ